TKMFSSIRSGEKVSQKLPFKELEQKGERSSQIFDRGTLDHLGVAYKVPEITHEDAPSLLVLSALLGGWRGMIGFFGDRFVPKTNRLYKRLIEGKIATEVSTYFPVNIAPPLLYFDLTLSPRVAIDKAKEELYSEIARVM